MGLIAAILLMSHYVKELDENTLIIEKQLIYKQQEQLNSFFNN